MNNKIVFAHIVEAYGRVWLATENGKLALYDNGRNNLSFLPVPFEISAINNLELLSDSTVAVSTDNGLIVMDSNRKFQQFCFPDNSNKRNFIHSAYKDRRGDYWMLSYVTGVVHYSVVKDKMEIMKSPRSKQMEPTVGSRYMVMEDPQGTIWVVPKKETLTYYDAEADKLCFFYEDGVDPTSIVSPASSNYCVDYQGNLWMASITHLEKLSFYDTKSKLLPIESTEEDVRCLFLDSDQRMWCSSRGCYVRIYDKEHRLLGYLNADGRVTAEQVSFRTPIFCMVEDADGNLWLGSRGNGLFRLKRKKDGELAFSINHYQHNPKDKYSLSGNDVFSLCRDHRNRIWIGCFGGGLNMVDLSKPNIQFVNSNNQLLNYPLHICPRIRCMEEANDSVLLVGTTNGLISFSTIFSQPEEVLFYLNERDATVDSTLCDNDVMYLLSDSLNQPYVVTWSGGIHAIESPCLLSNSIRFKVYRNLTGLNTNVSNAIIRDNVGKLWVIHENSFSMFSPDSGQFENYGTYAFRPNHIHFSESTVTLDAHGNIAVGSDQGAFIFNPYEIGKSTFAPSIHFDDRIAGIEVGIDDYITKPFSATYLLKRIESIIHQRQVLQELYLSSISTDTNSSLELVASQKLMTSYDKLFIQQLISAIDDNLDNGELLIEDLANQCSLGRGTFYKKIKTLFGLTPNDFLRNVRIKRAAQMIDSTNLSFSEVAYKCGFNDPSYFSKCFKKVMGASPSDYRSRGKSIM